MVNKIFIKYLLVNKSDNGISINNYEIITITHSKNYTIAYNSSSYYISICPYYTYIPATYKVVIKLKNLKNLDSIDVYVDDILYFRNFKDYLTKQIICFTSQTEYDFYEYIMS